MPRSKSSETRPKKRRKIVSFGGDPGESDPIDDDKETRPESTDDVVETESAEASFESHRLPITHSQTIGPSNMSHLDVLWVGHCVASSIYI